MWTDGPFIHELSDPWAPHPVVNRHIMNGGGGSTSAPNPPDYSAFYNTMAGLGGYATQTGKTLMDWAGSTGTNLSNIANAVSTSAGHVADWAQGKAQDLLSNWQSQYGPVYSSQVKNALNFIQNLPTTMEQWAGKYGADAATAIDQGKASLGRQFAAQGISPGIGQGAIDEAVALQRAAATTAASEQGRLAARQYADTLTGTTEQAGNIYPQLSTTMAGTGLQAGALQTTAPNQAAGTAAGLFSPGITMTSSAYTPYNAWGNMMSNEYNQQLGQFNANQQASANSPLNTIVPMIGGLALSAVSPALSAGLGSFMGPATQGIMAGMTGMGSRMAGSALPSITRIGSSQQYGATGGVISGVSVGRPAMPTMMAHGGDVPPVPLAGRMVPPTLSPSGGRNVDDVQATVDGNPNNKAAINTGEFIIPRWATEWYGEKFMQNLVAKAAKEKQEMTVAAPQAGPPHPGALNTQPPMMGATA